MMQEVKKDLSKKDPNAPHKPKTSHLRKANHGKDIFGYDKSHYLNSSLNEISADKHPSHQKTTHHQDPTHEQKEKDKHPEQHNTHDGKHPTNNKDPKPSAHADPNIDELKMKQVVLYKKEQRDSSNSRRRAKKRSGKEEEIRCMP